MSHELLPKVNEVHKNQELVSVSEVNETSQNHELKQDDCTKDQCTSVLTNNSDNSAIEDAYACNSDEDEENLIEDTSVQKRSRFKHLLLKTLHSLKNSIINIVTLLQ